MPLFTLLTEKMSWLSLELQWIKEIAVNRLYGVSKEETLINYIFENAKEGDPSSILECYDKFGYEKQFLMVRFYFFNR